MGANYSSSIWLSDEGSFSTLSSCSSLIGLIISESSPYSGSRPNRCLTLRSRVSVMKSSIRFKLELLLLLRYSWTSLLLRVNLGMVSLFIMLRRSPSYCYNSEASSPILSPAVFLILLLSESASPLSSLLGVRLSPVCCLTSASISATQRYTGLVG